MKDTELLTRIKDLIQKNQYYYQIKDKDNRLNIIHDTFIYIWNKLNKGELSDDWDDIKGYVFISCRNNCLLYLRKKQREKKTIPIDEEESLLELEEDDSDNEYIEMIQDKLQYFKRFLSNKLHKQVLDLRIEGYRLNQISEILDLKYKRVKSINTAMIKLLKTKKDIIIDKNSCIEKSEIVRRNKEYSVINIETDEVVLKCRNRRVIASKYNKSRLTINKLVDNQTVFNGNLIIKSVHSPKNGK